MRASFWVIAPLVARMGEARVSMPGGCAIGTRPVDLLIMALERLGAEIDIDGGYVVARAEGPQGRRDHFPKVTVGGTHTALMAASLAHGTTVIDNAAREPEIERRRRLPQQDGRQDHRRRHLAHRHRGRGEAHGARHSVLPDRIETGTYAMAVAMTGGDVLLEGARAESAAGRARRAGARPAPRSPRPMPAFGWPATAPASPRST